jgi:ABC-type Fe3+ transport system permease subunit
VTAGRLRPPDLWTSLTLVGLLILAILVVWPLWNVFSASFYAEFTNEFGLANYATFFGSRYFRRALWNSLYVSFMGTLLSLAIGLPLAVIAARYDLKGKALLRILVLLSLISPPFIGAYAWIMLLGRQGVVTQALLRSASSFPPSTAPPASSWSPPSISIRSSSSWCTVPCSGSTGRSRRHRSASAAPGCRPSRASRCP